MADVLFLDSTDRCSIEERSSLFIKTVGIVRAKYSCRSSEKNRASVIIFLIIPLIPSSLMDQRDYALQLLSY